MLSFSNLIALASIVSYSEAADWTHAKQADWNANFPTCAKGKE
jgi:hypothetical protein